MLKTSAKIFTIFTLIFTFGCAGCNARQADSTVEASAKPTASASPSPSASASPIPSAKASKKSDSVASSTSNKNGANTDNSKTNNATKKESKSDSSSAAKSSQKSMVTKASTNTTTNSENASSNNSSEQAQKPEDNASNQETQQTCTEVYHNVEGHWEKEKTGEMWVEDVPEQRKEVVVCGCGEKFADDFEWEQHSLDTDHGNYSVKWELVAEAQGHYEDVTRDKYVIDKQAWWETVCE